MKTFAAQFLSLAPVLIVVAATGAGAQPVRPDAPVNSEPAPPLVTPADPRSAATANIKVPNGIVPEVETMVRSGADPNVVKAFIQNWTGRFTVTADEILHLHDVGASSDVLTTLIHRSA